MTLLLCAALPLVAAAIVGIGGPRLGRRGAVAISSAALVLASGAALAIAQAIASGKASVVAEIGSWLPLRGADLVLQLDPNTLPLVLAGTSTAAIIAIASWPATQTSTYQVAILVGTAAVALLFTGGNLVLIAAAYGALSVASYLSAAHDDERAGAAAAAQRTLVLDRVADTAFVLATLGYFALFRTADLSEIASRVVTPRIADATFIAPSALLMTAVLAKSGQFPFHARAVTLREAPLGLASFETLASAAAAVALVRVALIVHPGVLAAGAALGALTAVIAVAPAVTRSDGRAALAWVAVVPAGIELVAIGSGENATAVRLFVATAVTLIGVTVVAAFRRPRLRWRGVGSRRMRREIADGAGLMPFWSAVARAYDALAGGLEHGTDVALDRAITWIGAGTLRAGRLVAHAEAGPAWRLEAIGLAALIALVAYWSLR